MNSNRQLPLLTKASSRSAPIRVAFLSLKALKGVKLGTGSGRHAADPAAEALQRLKRRARLYHSLAQLTKAGL
jgi:hypothetical protein